MADSTNPNGGPAFPVHAESHNRSNGALDGMSLRDYFAAKAMHAEMITTFSDATPEAADEFIEAARDAGRSVEDHLAFNAYLIADAMIRARAAGLPVEGVRTPAADGEESRG